MDMESHSKSTSFSASKVAFRERYIKRLMALLSCVQEKSNYSAEKHYRAVRKAVDLSLVCAAGRTSWSKALHRKLHSQAAKKKKLINHRESKIKTQIILQRLGRVRSRRRLVAKKHQPRYRKLLQSMQKKSKAQIAQSGKFEATSKVPCAVPENGNYEASQLASFRGLIPGGHHMGLSKLLDQAAHYIISLQLQVDSLSFLNQALSS